MKFERLPNEPLYESVMRWFDQYPRLRFLTPQQMRKREQCPVEPDQLCEQSASGPIPEVEAHTREGEPSLAYRVLDEAEDISAQDVVRVYSGPCGTGAANLRQEEAKASAAPEAEFKYKSLLFQAALEHAKVQQQFRAWVKLPCKHGVPVDQECFKCDYEDYLETGMVHGTEDA